MNILVIDDSKEDRDLIINHIKKIEKEEITVDECNCLEKAFQKLSINNYDAIILDLALPETDGIETVERTIEHLNKHNKETPIIILTGIEDYSIGRKAWMLGIKEFLIKDEIQAKDLSRALSFIALDSKKLDSKQKKSMAT